MNCTFLAALFTLSVAALSCAADPAPGPDVNVVIAGASIQINNIELRTGQPTSRGRYLTLGPAEQALGKAPDTYLFGDSVRIYSWRKAGIELQKGLHGVEEGHIFKFQIWFTDYYDKASKRHSGTFKGHLNLDGVEIGPDTNFETIRVDLRKSGFAVGEQKTIYYADKGEAILLTEDKSGKIQRVEVWCRP